MGTARKGYLPQVSLRASMMQCSMVWRSVSNPWRRLEVFVTSIWTPVSQAINSLGWIGVGDVHRIISIIYQQVSELSSSSEYPQSCQISISIHYLYCKVCVHLHFFKVTNSPILHQHFVPYPQPSHQLVNEKCKLLITSQHTLLCGCIFPLFLSKPGQSWLLSCSSDASLDVKAFYLCQLCNASPSGENTLFNNSPHTGALFIAVVCNQQLTDGED